MECKPFPHQRLRNGALAAGNHLGSFSHQQPQNGVRNTDGQTGVEMFRGCPVEFPVGGRLRRIPHTGRKITIFLTRIQIILAFRLPVVFTSPRSPCKPKSRVRLAVQDSRLSRGQHGFESRTRCQFLYSFRRHEQFMTPFFVFFRVVAACRSSLSPAFFSLSVFKAFSHFHFRFGKRRSCPRTARFCAD